MLTFVMVSSKGKIVLSVSNDLFSDQRVHKVCCSLKEAGYEVELVGRFLKGISKDLKRTYPSRRFHLWFNKGPLFYANLNIRLFFYLLSSKANIFVANDLDTLPANYLAAKLKGKKLVFDSHEFFTEVPELANRSRTRGIWERIEAYFLPKVKHAYTVSPSIADHYKKRYGIQMRLVRNFPYEDKSNSLPTQKEDVVIYQGALNVQRGLEELIEAFSYDQLKDAQLWLFGSGDIEDELKLFCRELELTERVRFFGRLDPKDLRKETLKAKIGVSIEHIDILNYRYALPNKVFDYIQAKVPVLYSNMEDLAQLLDRENLGEKLRSHEPKEIANQLYAMLKSESYSTWQQNCVQASKKFSWENEESELLKIFNEL